MMMRSIRANTKWIMLFLAVAFAGWLVFDWVASRDSAAAVGLNPVIAVVNGQEVRYARWSSELERALDFARAQSANVLTDEEVRQVEQSAWDGMINNILIEQEIKRLGIRVTDSEVRQAFRLSPPPEFLRHPAFQTDGRFDYAKYQQFFSEPGVDEALLLQLETYYRQLLPRTRLAQQLSEGAAVSDAQVWREYRARVERATVSYLAVSPADAVADDDLVVSENELRRYYRENRDDFERPATAVVDLVSLEATPSAADSAAARATADSLRAEIASGAASFEEAAAAISADPATAAGGGDLGRVTRGQLIPDLEEAAFALETGEVSAPVSSPQGLHLLTVTDRSADTLSLRHILIPVRLTYESEDALFDRMDALEGIALLRGLKVGADSTGESLREGVTLTEGFDFVPGAGPLGVAVDWALDASNPVGEVSEFFRNAGGYHIIEVQERTEGGLFPFEEVQDQIREILLAEKRKARALEVARQARSEVERAGSLEAAGASLGFPVAAVGPFSRREFVAGLGRDTEAVGAAFGAPIGVVIGPFDAGEAVVLLRVDDRTEADPEEYAAVREQLRAELRLEEGQRNYNAWLSALRESASIVDRRDRLRAGAEQA